MPWTTEQVEDLKRLWADGLSASQCAYRLGPGVTRNAVIGKVHRLGLSGRATTVKTVNACRKARARMTKPKRRRVDHSFEHLVRTTTGRWTMPAKLPDVLEPLPLPEIKADDIARISHDDLEANHCRWPVGDPKQPGFGFCGCERVPGLPYCSAHATRAFRAPQPDYVPPAQSKALGITALVNLDQWTSKVPA